MAQQEQSLDQLYRARDEFRSLMTHPAYEKLVGFIRAQVISRQHGALGVPIRSMDSCFELATQQGEVAAFKLVSSYAGLMVDKIQEEIDELLTAEQNSKAFDEFISKESEI